MESQSLLPSNNIKLEPVSEVGQVNNIKPEPLFGMTQCFYIKPEPASEVRLSNCIKPEPTIEVRPNNSINLESVSQTDCAASSAGDILTEILVFDQMESNTPASVKIEPPEVYLDYPGQEINPSSESCPSISIQEHSQMEICGNVEHVKQELSDVSFWDTSQTFIKIVDMTRCDITQEMAGHCNEESRLTKNCCQVSGNMFSGIKINEKLPAANENSQLQNVGTLAKQTQTSVKPLEDAVGYVNSSCQAIQAGGVQNISDVCDPGVSLNRHKRTHTALKPYKCDDCGRSFTTVVILKCHMKIHTREKPYKCDDCGRSFSTVGSLKPHMDKHTREKPYKCDDCGTSFATMQNLNRHKKIHTREKPYKCDDCGTSFATMHYLNRHKKIHTREKPYKCDDCGTSFATMHYLNRHKKIHTREKPYKCNYCGSFFTTAGSLKSHKRNHQGQTPYKCDECGASFIQNSHLLYHKRSLTGSMWCSSYRRLV